MMMTMPISTSDTNAAATAVNNTPKAREEALICERAVAIQQAALAAAAGAGDEPMLVCFADTVEQLRAEFPDSAFARKSPNAAQTWFGRKCGPVLRALLKIPPKEHASAKRQRHHQVRQQPRCAHVKDQEITDVLWRMSDAREKNLSRLAEYRSPANPFSPDTFKRRLGTLLQRVNEYLMETAPDAPDYALAHHNYYEATLRVCIIGGPWRTARGEWQWYWDMNPNVTREEALTAIESVVVPAEAVAAPAESMLEAETLPQTPLPVPMPEEEALPQTQMAMEEEEARPQTQTQTQVPSPMEETETRPQTQEVPVTDADLDTMFTWTPEMEALLDACCE